MISFMRSSVFTYAHNHKSEIMICRQKQADDRAMHIVPHLVVIDVTGRHFFEHIAPVLAAEQQLAYNMRLDIHAGSIG